MYVQKNSKPPRFEVDFKQRLEQQRTATDAVRLPLLGFQQYRVYDIDKKKDKDSIFGQYIGRGIKPVTTTMTGGSVLQHNFSQVWSILLDELHDPSYKVKWLKPKQVTFLRLKGHRVEEVE